MDAKLNQVYNKRHSHSSHTSTVVIYTLLTLHPTSSLITETFSPTNVITTMISAGPQIPTTSLLPTTISSTIPTITPTNTNNTPSTNPTGGNSSSPIIQESDRIPIIIVISTFVILLLLSLLLVYVRKKRKESQQKALASAIVAAEAGELPTRTRTILRDSPSPPPPPPPPPPTPTPLPHALLNDDDIPPPPRYKISTLQIEPMTRRLTMNLSQKGKSIIVNEDRRPNQIRRWSETTDGETKIEEECQEVINVTSLKDDDDDSSIGEGDSKGKSFSRRFSARKSFWK
ncbi:unnamed protein product [Rhizophagus irregularis]|nr:unnamed protein product [Rhizophagus irregularis]CAB5390582.1 unnamed protein product [Rhizophagus irregularis]